MDRGLTVVGGARGVVEGIPATARCATPQRADIVPAPARGRTTTVLAVDMLIRPLDLADAEWARLTLTGDGRTAFHCPPLVRSVARAFGRRLTGYAAYQSSTMVGGIVVGDAQHGQPGPLSMVSFNGPLVRPSASQHQASRDRHSSRVITALLRAVGDKRGANIRMLPSTGDIREVLATGWQARPTFSYEMGLHSLERAWDAMDGDRRRLVRRAERLGYQVTVRRHAGDGLGQLVDEMIRLHVAHQSTYGPVTPPDRTAMRRIVDDLLASGCGRLFIATDADGSAVAVQLAVVWGGRAANLFTGSSPAHAHLGANTLLRWQAARHLHDEGVVRLDLNGARPGTAGRFKASLGAELQPRYDLHLPDRRPVALARRAAQRARRELTGVLSRGGTHG